jgi:hypothetical protein
MRIAITILALCAVSAVAAEKLIPVSAWPRVIQTAGKQIVNPSEGDCVKAGYRLIPAKPVTPIGKRIKSETLVQDAKKASYVTWQIVYDDIPAPVIVPPEVLTNVAADRVSFLFSTNGQYRGVRWLDAPATNKVPK